MSNLCENELTLRGGAAELAAVCEALVGEGESGLVSDGAALVPRPRCWRLRRGASWPPATPAT